MATQMNKNIRVVEPTNSTCTEFTERFVSERVFQQDTFKQFITGDAAYVFNSLHDFSTLFQMLRYTNICMFNANYKTNGWCGDDDGIEAFRKALPYKFDALDYDWAIIWTVPQDTPGSYDISPEFIESVAMTIGPDVLSRLRRMEFCIASSANHSPKLSDIPWLVYSAKAIETERDGYYIPVKVSGKNIGGPMVPPNRLFNIVRPNFEMLGTSYLTDIIETHLRYRKSLKQSLKQFMNYVAATMADLSRNNSDCGSMSVIFMKAQAILAWLVDPLKYRTCICFSNRVGDDNHVMEQLTSIMMFSGIVLPTQFSKCTGVFMDEQGMIRLIHDDTAACLTGYRLIEDCDNAIDLIYKTIKDTVITPLGDNGPNFLAHCHYPVFDNMPGIFWNGHMF